MNRLVTIFTAALVLALPCAAAAKHRPTPAPASSAAPAMVSCKAGDPVVWINTESKVYHLAGSEFYGKTKHGKYACQSDAAALGARAAKREGAASAASSASPEPQPSPAGKKKHHKRSDG